MDYQTLGETGLEVSPICLGTSRFGREIDGEAQTTREDAHDLLDAFAERGGNFLDTAEIYGGGTSEEWIGEWLQDQDREDVVIASKVAGPMGEDPNRSGLSRKRIRAAIEGTLDRLDTEYVDVYYIHWWDENTPIRETLAALDDLVREGKVHYLGASNLSAWSLLKSRWESDVCGLADFDVVQPRYNVAFREDPSDFLDACADQGIGVCPYSALERGFLTGKYDRTEDGEIVAPEGSRGDLEDWEEFEERQWRVLDAVQTVADDVSATPAQVALRWLIDRDRFTCVPITAARSIDQLEESMGAIDVELSDEQRSHIADTYEE